MRRMVSGLRRPAIWYLCTSLKYAHISLSHHPTLWLSPWPWSISCITPKDNAVCIRRGSVSVCACMPACVHACERLCMCAFPSLHLHLWPLAGVCGGSSCVRRSGESEADSCCDKTAYDWIYEDPLKPECSAAPRDVPCNHTGPPPTTNCPGSPLCDLLHHP